MKIFKFKNLEFSKKNNYNRWNYLSKKEKSFRQIKRERADKKRADSLKKEVEFIYKNCNKNSDSCRRRYRESMNDFVNFLIENHQVKQLKNLQEVHILNYIKYKRNQERKVSDATLNLNVTAILFTLKQVGYMEHLYPLKPVKYYINRSDNDV